MAKRANQFQTIRSEGGLLPPDLLRRVIDPRGTLQGTKPQDYGLPAGERLSEVITQSWNRLRRHWLEFRAAAERLPEGEAGTGLTNDKWSLPLLRELGFGLVPAGSGPEIAGRTYAISRFFGSVPIHLIGCGLNLDRRAAGVRGAAAGNPHGLVQEFLNRSPDHLWGIVSNGLQLRVLRDNQALSRQSFLEFDLESMLSAEAYSDFVLLWLAGHATRFTPRDGSRIETCWLEEWTKEAQEQGTRALKDLRGSVERALQVLGEGLTSHSKNAALREALRSGSLGLEDFHGQLLRVVYRLIFLFVAEDRTLEGQSLLHPPDDSETARVARERYAAYYGTARLREVAGKIKGSRHTDMWRQFQILVGALSGDDPFEGTRRSLALPALGSFLWSPDSTAAFNDAELTNHDFLESLRHLAYTRQSRVLRPVDYKNLGAEELGGVYESLLALTPQVSADGARFTFAEFAGNERKTSGSYYTPDSLVQSLLDSALDPVVEAAAKGKTGTEAEQSILALKVCDPAVGSGHFLVGAAHRLARHLARVRAQAQGESEPSPLLYQHALRDIIGRCLYGVDANPMAAELCRVSLWLEALEPGKPLSFLDHHIRIGNSLFGATPDLIVGGLPDETFNPIEGDESRVCAALKRRNRQEREGGQIDLGLQKVAEPRGEYDTLASRSRSIDQATDDSIEAIRRKAEQFHRLIVSPEYRHRQQLADAWCAAFVWPKKINALAEPITTDTIRQLDTDVHVLSPAQRTELERLSTRYQFFHWHLAFPEVFARGGFDCILANPPWERVKLQEKEWFADRSPEIANAPNAAARKRLIETLKRADPALYQQFLDDARDAEAESHLLRNSGRYPLCGRGDINLYAVFAECMRGLVNAGGRAGAVLPTGIATDDTTKLFFQDVIANKSLASLFDFENKEYLFRGVHAEQKFCLFTAGRGARPVADAAEFVFFAHAVEDLRDPERRLSLSLEDIALLNPNTRTCPIFRSRKDAELTKALYRRVPVLIREARGDASEDNPWSVRFCRMFDMTNDSHLFRGRSQLEIDGWQLHGNIFQKGELEYLPLYEGKLTGMDDHRLGTFEGVCPDDIAKGNERASTASEKSSPSYCSLPRSWVSKHDVESSIQAGLPPAWLAFHGIANPNNERTFISAVVPPSGAGNSLPLLTFATEVAPSDVACLCGNLNSFVLDYVSRLKISSRNFNFFVVKQLPVLADRLYGERYGWCAATASLRYWLLPRVLELAYSAWDLEAFAQGCGWAGPPFRWDEERRFLLRCELDAAFFHLYLPADVDGRWCLAQKADGCPHDETQGELAELKRHFPAPRDALAHIMDTFPIVQRKDEEKYGGDYRTKRVILEIYDAMQEAILTGRPYSTRLDPPPGPPQDAEGNLIPYAQIAGDPPPNIHLPRDGALVGSVALQLSDLATRFPTTPYLLLLGASRDAQAFRVRPVRTADIRVNDRVVLASSNLRNSGTAVSAAIGRLRAEVRTDASDDSTYVLVTVRSDEGVVQARFSEEQWRNLSTVGVVEESSGT